ncbi:MAG: septum formation family protein [Nocardioidaceae bacterium]
MRSRFSLIAVALCAGLLAAGCSGGDSGEPDDSDDAASSTPTTSQPPPPPPPAPKNGRCYELSERQLEAAHVDADPVDCAQGHTAQTYLVGKLRGDVVRSSDTVDSTAISTTVDQRCATAFGPHIGGDAAVRTLARVRYVWFVPSEEEFNRGANWFRCDVVTDREHGTPAQLPASTKGLLDAEDALDTWGTCDQTDGELNAESDWRMCAESHNWRAISVLSVGEGDTPWPGAAALQDRAGECETDVRSYLGDSTGALEFQWSYPTEQQWRAGRRYGLCWTEDS